MADRLYKVTLAALAAFGIGMVAWAEYAEAAEPVCDTTVKIDAYLRGKGYAEASFGIISPQAAMVIYATPDGDAWVAVLIGTDGKSCFSYEGMGWFPGAVQEAPVEGERAA